MGVYGVALAGWSSNSKYPLLGGLRSSAQMVSYELALTMSVVGVILMAGTFNLSEIVDLAAGFPLGIRAALESDRLADAANSGLSSVFHGRGRGNQSRAVRSGRSGIRAGRRVSHRVLELQIRHVFHGRIRQHDYGLLPGDDSVFRRLALAVPADARCLPGRTTSRPRRSPSRALR